MDSVHEFAKSDTTETRSVPDTSIICTQQIKLLILFPKSWDLSSWPKFILPAILIMGKHCV